MSSPECAWNAWKVAEFGFPHGERMQEGFAESEWRSGDLARPLQGLFAYQVPKTRRHDNDEGTSPSPQRHTKLIVATGRTTTLCPHVWRGCGTFKRACGQGSGDDINGSVLLQLLPDGD